MEKLGKIYLKQIFDEEYLPPDYENSYDAIPPEKLKDIHILLSLIANTLMENTFRLDKKLEKKINRTYDYSPRKLAEALYELYLYASLNLGEKNIQKNADEIVRQTMEEYPLQYHNKYRWDISAEIYHYLDFHLNSGEILPLPPKTSLFYNILDDFTFLLSQGHAYSKNKEVYEALEQLQEAIEYVVGHEWMLRYRAFIHKTIKNL